MSDITGEAKGCPQCGSQSDWGASSWCPDCGFYPAIGALVETPKFECEEQIYDHWWEAVPEWLWVLAGGVGVIFVTNVLGRVIFGETIRLYWTIGQMALGLIAFATCHFLAYMFAASKSDRIGPMDAFLKPIATWQPVLLSMPKTTKLLWGATWGMTAIFFGFLIVGGINIQELAEAHRQAHADEPKKKRASPMAFMIKSATMVAKAQGNLPSNAEAPASMEDALAEFTGAAGVGEDGSLSFGGESMSDTVGSIGAAADPDAYIAEQKRIASGGSPGGESDGGGSHGGGDSGDSNDGGYEGDEDSSGEDDDSTESHSTTSTVSVNKGPKSSSASGSKSSTTTRSGGASGGGTSNTSPGTSASSSRSSIRRDEKLQCLVFGYTTNAQGDARSLLLAAPQHGGLKFVGKVSVEDVDPDALSKMTERFSSLQQRFPTVYSPYGGRWLKPELFCEVDFSGWSINGRLNNPYISNFAFVTPEVSPQ